MKYKNSMYKCVYIYVYVCFTLELVHNFDIVDKDKSGQHPPEISIPDHL